MKSGQFAFELFQHRTHNILAALEHGFDVLIDFLFDVVVLPDVAVKFNFHGATRYRTGPARQGYSRFSHRCVGKKCVPLQRLTLFMVCGTDQRPRLRMVHWNMDEVPAFPLPPDFALKWYAPGDEDHWNRIHLRADRLNNISPHLFAEQFGSNSHILQERQCYLVAPNQEIIGTATAWYNHDFLGKNFGRVHWLAIDPAYQGQGLSRLLLSAICQRLRSLGHNCA